MLIRCHKKPLIYPPVRRMPAIQTGDPQREDGVEKRPNFPSCSDVEGGDPDNATHTRIKIIGCEGAAPLEKNMASRLSVL